MDNGLIFPYPRRSAHDEPGVLTIRTLPAAFGPRVWGSVGPGG
jgi:hypothetical protein